MICPNCQSEVQDTNYKCPNCREILKQDMDPSQFRPEPQPQKKGGSGSKAVNFIVFIITVAVVVALVYFGIIQKKDRKTSKTDSGNETSGVTKNARVTEITDIAPVINSETPGEEIDIIDFIQTGKITIFDFYSDYCGPCRQIAPYLKSLDKKRSDVKVIKIDVNRPGVRGIDWKSPVLSQYNIRAIPHFVIYDENGDMTASGKSATREVIRMLQEAGISR